MSGAFPPLFTFMVCTRATLPVIFTHKLTRCVVSDIMSVLNDLHSCQQSSFAFYAIVICLVCTEMCIWLENKMKVKWCVHETH